MTVDNLASEMLEVADHVAVSLSSGDFSGPMSGAALVRDGHNNPVSLFKGGVANRITPGMYHHPIDLDQPARVAIYFPSTVQP
jgi:hypothetical protein